MTTSPKYAVCPDCHGEGSHVDPTFVYTQEEIEQEFDGPEDFADHIDDIRRGVYNVPCDYCKGKRVVTSDRVAEYADELAYRAEVAAEQRYFGIY